MARSDTSERLLNSAETLVQRRGFNAFSYRDLAAAVGIKTASIHYHFPAKADLGLALMTRYRERLEVALADIDAATPGARDRLAGFVAMYRDTAAAGDRICLCGSMSADVETLPDDLRAAVRDYLERSAEWVRGVIRDGRGTGELDPRTDERAIASMLVCGLQGALLQARAMRSTEPIDLVDRTLAALLTH